MAGYANQVCPDPLLDRFSSSMVHKLWRVNGLMLVNAFLMGIVVSIGVCRPRARRHPVLGFILLGASVLFLPIVSNVAATVGTDMYFTSGLYGGKVVAATCEPGLHVVLVLVWTAVVVTIGVNSSVVAATDAREGRTVEPPMELLVKAIWVLFLIGIAITSKGYLETVRYIGRLIGNEKATELQLTINFGLAALLPFYKMCSKYIFFKISKGCVAFGRSNQVIVGYMAELRESPDTEPINSEPTPKLTVWIDRLHYKLVEQPHGFRLGVRKQPHHGHNDNGDGLGSKKLVTLDRVWEQLPDNTYLMQEHKDLCFSHALFRLLRCRFAKYTVCEAGFMKAQRFFRKEYLNGDQQHDRVFSVIADELSFINVYYNSYMPIYCEFSSLFVALTLISIGYCLYMLVFISRVVSYLGVYEQVFCVVWCPGPTSQQSAQELRSRIGFGNKLFDVIPVYLVLAVLLLSEVKDVVYYFCSNWTKVILICRYLLQHNYSPTKKMLRFVLNHCNLKLVNSWGNEMSQCSILRHRQWWKPNYRFWNVRGFPVEDIDKFFLWRLFGFHEEKSIKELSAVKKSIFRALNHEGLPLKVIQPPPPPVTVPSTDGNFGNALFSASGCKTVAETILVWHIATSLFELRDQEQPDPESGMGNPPPHPLDPDNKIAATQLSRYCAYLVACRPELLPDEDEWCKKLYADVLENADRILCAAGEAARFQELVNAFLGAELDDNKVLRNGATLAQQMVVLNKGWKQLADFWSEMILYIAPSENLDGHAEAIARGGEMVTLLWALLAHAGIVNRPDDIAAGTNKNVVGDALNTSSADHAPDAAGDHRV